jgi:hypothetical protein
MKPEWEERGCKHKGCTHLFGEEGHHGDFHRRVLAYGSEEDMLDFEIELLTRREHYFRIRYYNRVVMWCRAVSGEDNPAYKHGKYGTKKYAVEYSRKYYTSNKDKIAENGRKYRLDNKDKIAETKRKYRLDNKDKLVEYKRKYCLDNKDKIAEYKRKYYAANKDRIKLQRLQKEKTSEQ